MALIIENGTGVAGAEAWADVTACSAWAVLFYGQSLTGSTADKEAAIRRAVAYMNTLVYKGTRTFGRGQTLSWPRTGVTDCEGLAVGANEIPPEIITAQHILSRAEFVAPGILSPQGSASTLVKREKVDVIEVEYDVSSRVGSVDDIRTIVTAAIDALKCFLAVQPGARRMPDAVVV